MRKPNFPAQFKVKTKDGKVIFLCLRHWQEANEARIIETTDPLPDEHEISCQECKNDHLVS